MKMIKYPSTEQFRSVLKKVYERTRFVEYNEDLGTSVFDESIPLPTLTFQGTVKIHGTQGSVVSTPDNDIYYQSRKNIVTIEKDNAGFAFFCTQREDVFKEIFNKIKNTYPELTKNAYITVYGEFCGGNIQKGVAVTGLPKMFVVFAVKITPNDEAAFWLNDLSIIDSDSENNIFNIQDFETYTISINFNDKVQMQEVQEEMLRLTTLVGDECPVAKAFNKIGLGEGIVWTCFYKDERIIFKTKDLRHSKSKIKVPKLKEIDSVLENKKREFVNNIACTESRLNQMYTEIVHSVHNGNEDLMSTKDIGLFLKLINQDIIKENLSDLLSADLTPKMINSMVASVAKEFFFNALNEISSKE